MALSSAVVVARVGNGIHGAALSSTLSELFHVDAVELQPPVDLFAVLAEDARDGADVAAVIAKGAAEILLRWGHEQAPAGSNGGGGPLGLRLWRCARDRLGEVLRVEIRPLGHRDGAAD